LAYVSVSPSKRWGHSLCMISENEAVLVGGQGDKQQFCKDSIWHLDLGTQKHEEISSAG